MNPQEEIRALEQIIDQILAGIEEALINGEVLSDDLQGMIAEELQITAQRIDFLRSQQAPQIPETLEMTQAMPSSNVEGFAYDPESQRLYVRFLGDYPNREGPIYQYENVPEMIFDIFRKGAIPAKTDGQNRWGKWWRGKFPSIGAAMYHVIRQFPYQRVA